MEGDDTEGGDPSVGVQRERGKISNFKIISLIGMCALYFQTWGTYAPATLEKKKKHGKLPPSNLGRTVDVQQQEISRMDTRVFHYANYLIEMD